jgi:putative tryptophan/tyrosine transport system substrate-binding protein
MRGLERPRALLELLSIALSSLTAGCDWSSEPVRPKAPVPRVGYLTSGRCPSDEAGPSPFLEGLRARGHVIGQTIVIECRFSDQADDQRFRTMAGELIEAKVDVIVGISSTATRALVSLTRTIPVVALDLETDPIASGLAASLARPGGNVTGIFLDAVELSGKRLEVMHELVPGLARVAVLWDASMDPAPLRAAEMAGRAIGIKLQTLAIRRPEELGGTLDAAARARIGAVMVIQSPFMDVHGAEIAALAIKRRLPAAGLTPNFVKQGGLVSYGPDVLELFRYLGSFIDRIVKGARPGELPIERPTRLYLTINLKTAKALGVTVPASLRARADQIIE